MIAFLWVRTIYICLCHVYIIVKEEVVSFRGAQTINRCGALKSQAGKLQLIAVVAENSEIQDKTRAVKRIENNNCCWVLDMTSASLLLVLSSLIYRCFVLFLYYSKKKGATIMISELRRVLVT